MMMWELGMTGIYNYYQGKKILITGGAGYLASVLVALLSDTDCRIIRLDQKKPAAVPRRKAAEIVDLVGDVSIDKTWEEPLDGIEIVFHFAAQTSVYTANKDTAEDLKRNVMPMVHLLEACRRQKIKPVILFSGTVTESGMPAYLPVDETHPDNPITVYDLHKLMAENYLKYYCRQGLVRGATLRLANVYGPGPESGSAGRGILNLMVKKALQGENLTLYGTGEYLRDYVYVYDVADAFLKAAASIDKVNGHHFVIGSGKGTTLAEAFNLVAEKAAVKTGKKVRIISVDPPSELSLIENRNFIADNRKFISGTGWKAEYSLTQGIEAIIESVLKR
ncbi:MAG: NAD-dependent epimerase/dehydratase family protein [Candidatus Omnitrophota bacterium]|nr:NAD-dependent epimerase/dehydratase family protein [Candidatus Omnitrophota bacterium]